MNGENLPKSEIKKLRVDEAVRRKKRRALFWIIAALLIAGGGIGAAVYLTGRSAQNLPGELMPDQGRTHVTSTEHPQYNSNPPTSGWHYPQPAEWGAYSQEIPDEVLIHNMEHGGVWISYRPDIPEEVKKKLEDFYKKWGRKVVVAPRSANDADIALAAWNRLDKFNVSEYSDERVDKFIKAFRNKGPEFVP